MNDKKQISWFKLLFLVPPLFLLLAMTKVVPKKWERNVADKVLKMMRSLVK